MSRLVEEILEFYSKQNASFDRYFECHDKCAKGNAILKDDIYQKN